MDEQQGSLWPLERLVAPWAEGARDEEIGPVVWYWKQQRRRRGLDLPVETDRRDISWIAWPTR